MRRIPVILAIILCLFLLPNQAAGEESTERLIVSFNGEINTEIIEKYAVEMHHQFDEFSAVSMTISSAQKQALLSEKVVELVEEDPLLQTNGQIIDWGYEKVQAKRAKEWGWTGKGVKIGIVDTGIRTDHRDLRVAGGVSFVEESPSFNDDEGHGTHVAGILAALDNTIGTVGVAPDAEIYAIKALNSEGEGNLSDIVAGIQWAIDQKMDIVNLSFTAPDGSYLLSEAVKKANQQGLILVAASGNALQPLSSNTDVLFPARYPGVISVGSINLKNEKSTFSYFGPSLEFVAPGEKILSTYLPKTAGSPEGYAYMSGTSMAAPFVTGIAALYKQAYPLLSNLSIREMMQQSAVDLGKAGKDIDFGYGIVQAPDVTTSFPDIAKDAWFSQEVSYLYERSIITGFPDGKFYPSRPVTRAEAMTMIGKALEMDGQLRETSFLDVPSQFYASGYIEEAVLRQIITGYPDKTFKPKAWIIRGDAAIMLQKAFAYDPVLEQQFQDVREDKYYYPSVNAIKTAGITSGYPDGTYKPETTITRAEFAVLLARAIEKQEAILQ